MPYIGMSHLNETSTMKYSQIFALSLSAIMFVGCTEQEQDEVRVPEQEISATTLENRLAIGDETSAFWLVDKDALIQAYEDVTGNSVEFMGIWCAAPQTPPYDLFFQLDGSSGESYPLTYDKDLKIYYLGIEEPSATHSCTGDPCPSCRMVALQELWITGCKCSQETVNGENTKCNHNFSQNSVNANSLNIIHKYHAILNP